MLPSPPPLEVRGREDRLTGRLRGSSRSSTPVSDRTSRDERLSDDEEDSTVLLEPNKPKKRLLFFSFDSFAVSSSLLLPLLRESSMTGGDVIAEPESSNTPLSRFDRCRPFRRLPPGVERLLSSRSSRPSSVLR